MASDQDLAVMTEAEAIARAEAMRVAYERAADLAGQADAHRYRQMGNAVCVPVVEWIGRRAVAWLERQRLEAQDG